MRSTFSRRVSSGDCSVVGLQSLCARDTRVSASPPLFVTLPTVISGRHGNSRSVFSSDSKHADVAYIRNKGQTKRGLCWGNDNNDNDNQRREPPAVGAGLQGTVSKSLMHEDKETRLLRIGANVFASLRMWRWCICVTLLGTVEALDVSSLFSFWKPGCD